MTRFLIAVFLLIASPAMAVDEVTITGIPGAKNIDIWRSYQAMQEGVALRRGGAIAQGRGDLVFSRISCTVPKGTKASVTASPSSDAVEIIVTSGEQIGCKGALNTNQVLGASN